MKSLLSIRPHRAVLLASTLLITGCASTGEDTEWRPVEPESRAIVFAAPAFGMNESVYTSTSQSYVQRYEYGVWRAEGGAERTFVADLARSRPGGNYAFASPAPPLREVVADHNDDPPKAFGEVTLLTASFGEIEVLGYQNSDSRYCTAFRWFGWQEDEWRGMLGGGSSLGRARFIAHYCEVGDGFVPVATAQKVVDSVTLRDVGYK